MFMSQISAALLAIGCGAMASAQVVFEPPPQMVTYHDYYYEQAMARLNVLSLHRVVMVPPASMGSGSPGGAYGCGSANGCIGATAIYPVPSGIDPLTGEVLSFRKGDLLAASSPEPVMENVMGEGRKPTTRPADEPNGQISIEPWRGWDAVKARGR